MSLPPPPTPDERAEPRADAPIPTVPPTEEGGRKGVPWIAVLVGAIVLVIGVATAVIATDGTEAAEPTASVSPGSSQGPSASGTPTSAASPDALPESVAGEDRLTGSTADAFEDVIRSIEGADLAIAYGVYGTASDPRFIVAHLTEPLPMDEFPGASLLELTADSGGFELTGTIQEGEEGGVAAACSNATTPGMSFLCLLNSETGYFMLMGVAPAPGGDMLAIAYGAGS